MLEYLLKSDSHGIFTMFRYQLRVPEGMARDKSSDLSRGQERATGKRIGGAAAGTSQPQPRKPRYD